MSAIAVWSEVVHWILLSRDTDKPWFAARKGLSSERHLDPGLSRRHSLRAERTWTVAPCSPNARAWTPGLLIIERPFELIYRARPQSATGVAIAKKASVSNAMPSIYHAPIGDVPG